MIEQRRVLAANAAFYAALRSGDFPAMEALWSRRPDVAVYHPNWPGIDGRDAVMDSWRELMLGGVPPDIQPLDPTVILTRRTALVICVEDLGRVRAIATNVFVLEDGAWRLTHHQASPLAMEPRRRRTDGGR